MYAVVKTGGKQYRVAPGEVVVVEKLLGQAGDTVALSDVLMVDDEGKSQVGTPVLKDVAVVGEIVEQDRAKKIIVFKKKRRQNYRRKKGHRQDITVLRVKEVVSGKAAQTALKAYEDLSKAHKISASKVEKEKASEKTAPKAKAPKVAAKKAAAEAPKKAAAPKSAPKSAEKKAAPTKKSSSSTVTKAAPKKATASKAKKADAEK